MAFPAVNLINTLATIFSAKDSVFALSADTNDESGG